MEFNEEFWMVVCAVWFGASAAKLTAWLPNATIRTLQFVKYLRMSRKVKVPR